MKTPDGDRDSPYLKKRGQSLFLSELSAPSFVAWQVTRDCNLACLHCCTDSAPGRPFPNELTRQESLSIADQIVKSQVPYVLLAGGEPLIVPHFFEIARVLGEGGVYLKIESNGQIFGEKEAEKLSRLPIRSLQISIDGATQAVYSKMRPGASLEKALFACRAARKFNLPLEITFAPTKINISEAAAVIDLAASLGAFRLNTGHLMRLGTAAKLWGKLNLSSAEYEKFYNLLEMKEKEFSGKMEILFRPFSIQEDLLAKKIASPSTILILPDGRVRVSGFLPYTCADLRKETLIQAWERCQKAYQNPKISSGFEEIIKDDSVLAAANQLRPLETSDLPAMV